MPLQDQIKKDLAAAMKAKDQEKTSALRVILGEFSRHPDKNIGQEDALKIIKKLVKSEKEVLAQSGDATNRFISVCEAYLPRQVDEEEIRVWIQENIDFSQFKNKMQAMGAIMKHFGDTADGNLVKKVLQSL